MTVRFPVDISEQHFIEKLELMTSMQFSEDPGRMFDTPAIDNMYTWIRLAFLQCHR